VNGNMQGRNATMKIAEAAVIDGKKARPSTA
jgi:hypothetical protein